MMTKKGTLKWSIYISVELNILLVFLICCGWFAGNVGHFEDDEWYFYTTRPNSSLFLTKDGYFAASMDEQIFHNNQVVGFKQIMTFYLGRPPTGMKTNWVVLEFRVNPLIFPAGKLDNLVQEKVFNPF